jgi:anti-anti-sigma regulatory factor
MPGDHSYIAYTDNAELRVVGSAFLREGAELGQRVAYYAWGSTEVLLDDVAAWAGVEELLRQGTLNVVSLDRHFAQDQVPDASTLVAFWSEATSSALDAGFTALRVVTDTTPWVRGTQARSEFLRTEHYVDRYRLGHPFTQLCAGDAGLVEESALAEVGCIHPSTVSMGLPVHLHAAENADFGLTGELDAFTVGLLERVVAAVWAGEPNAELVVDASALTFVDHRNLMVLQRQAEAAAVRSVVLRDAPMGARRLVELLQLTRVRVETTP